MNVVSLGVGVQSSCLALMACRGEIQPKPDLVVFSDPGWEEEETYEYAEWLKKEIESHGIDVIYTSGGNIKEDLLKAAADGTRMASLPFFTQTKSGEIGMVMRQCTMEYKVQPVRRAIKEYLGVKTARQIKQEIVLWMGISTDEIERVKTSQVKWIENRFPLIEKVMNRLDCMNWLARNGYPVPPKSSCIGCPFHSDYTWLDMKRNKPKAWADAVAVDKAIRHMPRMKNEVYLHRSGKPLDEVDLNENQIEFNFDGFGNECEGYCGI